MKIKTWITRFAAVLSVLAAPVAQAATNAGVPALRVTAPDGESSILIGSAHVSAKGMLQPDASIFTGARRYVTEHLGLPQPGDQGAGGALAPWAANLTQEEVATYLERASCAGYTTDDALSLLRRPSAQFANQIAYTTCERVAGVPDRDTVIWSFKPASVPEGFLEDDAAVEATRRSVPPHLTDLSFKWALAHDPRKVMADIGDAVNRGDYDTIRTIFVESLGDPRNAEAFSKIMVDGRNAAWMPRLKQFLDEGHAVIVVGAMHLPGENGLIQKLRDDGYRVDAVTLPALPE
ncbi:TraB/GumN family protein [Paraburkholderia sp. SIMBA_054]|uniref:TraB/GumN family protein n=1 Tax=Paraburkholderia sp. SIMBA_054 TaxID=3085795 RepID=UPI00397BAEBC